MAIGLIVWPGWGGWWSRRSKFLIIKALIVLYGTVIIYLVGILKYVIIVRFLNLLWIIILLVPRRTVLPQEVRWY